MMFGKRKYFTFSVCAALLISVLAGCNIHGNTAQPTSASETTAQMTTAAQTRQTDSDTTDDLIAEEESTTPNTALFAEVYDEYTEALISKTPVLISEFTAEAGILTESDYAEALLEEKKGELSDIFNEGLARYVMIVGDTGADNEEYEYWHNKLEAIYNAQIEELISSCSAQNGMELGEDMDY